MYVNSDILWLNEGIQVVKAWSNSSPGTGPTKKFMLKSDEFGEEVLHVIVKSKSGNTIEVYQGKPIAVSAFLPWPIF
jgi:hypothetical protein